MVAVSQPTKVVVRSYQVGFGDCFLVSFEYRTCTRHVLIDFGSTGLPTGTPRDHLVRVARCLEADCGGKLHAIVATHRHADHINGFDPGKNRTGPGCVIEALRPDVVVQPWTEDPAALVDAREPSRVGAHSRSFARLLNGFHSIDYYAASVGSPFLSAAATERQIAFLAEVNTSNSAAVGHLANMGRASKARYVHYGSSSGINLPGVRTTVLGPPTIEQSNAITRQRANNPQEYWHILQECDQILQRDIPFGTKFRARHPTQPARWIVDRLRLVPEKQFFDFVRTLDQVLNNTSVVLLFQVGCHSLLFPGDAQLESWQYLLAQIKVQPALRAALENLTVYKVGHHGSLNATPKTFWNMLRSKRSMVGTKSDLVLHSFLSSMAGKHGSEAENTEVPRGTLVEALRKDSILHTTEALPPSELRLEVSFSI